MRRTCTLPQEIPEIGAAGHGILQQMFHGFQTDAPRRSIDDAQQGDIIARRREDAQVSDQIADFLAIEKGSGADEHIGQLGRAESGLKTPRGCSLVRQRIAKSRGSQPPRRSQA